MFKHFINLEDFRDQEIIKNKIIENFDYFSANLICLFIRQLDIKLGGINVDLEDTIKKYDVNFNIKSTFNAYNNKITTESKTKIDIENNLECLPDNIKPHISNFCTANLNLIEDSLKNYLNFMSVATNTIYEKNIDLNLYNAYDIYHNLNNQFNFGNKIEDKDIEIYLRESSDFVLNFEKAFTTKIHLLLINEFGNDLHINFKSNKIWKHSGQDMNNHPDKDVIEQHEYYKLAKSLYLQFNTIDTCYLPVINHNIKNIESNSSFNYEIESFKSAIEKNILNNLLTTENNNINVNKSKRI